MANVPDFTFKPDQTIIAAMQNANQQRMQQEQLNQQKKAQEFQMVKETTKAVSDMVGSMVSAAQERTKRNLVNGAKEILAKPEPAAMTPVEGPMLPTAGISETTTLQERPMAPNPEVDTRKRAKFDIAAALAPEEFGKAMVKSALPEASASVGRGFQQSGIQITGKDGQVRTVPVSYDTANGTYIHPITKQPITDMSQLQDLPDKGYSQGFRAAGYTQDGKEIVAEQRTGKKYTIGEDGEYEEYAGQVFEKKENLPAGLTESLGELEYSQEVLGRIAQSFNPDFVGPVAARAGKMSQYLEALTDEQRVEFYGNIAEYKNSIIKAITGAQMSEVEAKRIVQQIPNENASPAAFKTALQRAWRSTNERVQAKVKGAEKGGYAYRGTPMSSEQAEALLAEKFGKFQDKSTGTKDGWQTTKSGVRYRVKGN